MIIHISCDVYKPVFLTDIN